MYTNYNPKSRAYMTGHRKSIGEQVKETAIQFAWVVGIYLVLYWLFMALTYPVRAMLRTDKQNLDRKLERIKSKVLERKALRQKYLSDPNDPLNQYVERTKMHPELYEGMETYASWFEDLKNGRILDSTLRWAPEVYAEVEGNFEMSSLFLDYLARQLELCRASGYKEKVAFLNTVRKYYPEFTPKYSVMVSEIEKYREESLTGQLYEELVQVITSKGVPMELARVFAEDGLTAEDIQRLIPLVQRFVSRGCSPEFIQLCLASKISPENPNLEFGEVLLKTLGRSDLAMAGMTGDLSAKDVIRIQKSIEAESEELDPDDKLNYFRREMSDRCEKAIREGCLREISGRG